MAVESFGLQLIFIFVDLECGLGRFADVFYIMSFLFLGDDLLGQSHSFVLSDLMEIGIEAFGHQFIWICCDGVTFEKALSLRRWCCSAHLGFLSWFSDS